jgi:hypothetical protein
MTLTRTRWSFALLLMMTIVSVSLTHARRAGAAEAGSSSATFTAFDPAHPESAAVITLQYNPANHSGADWSHAAALKWYTRGDEADILRAAIFLREAMEKMTGHAPQVVSSNDLSKGIVLTTLAGAPEALRNDPAVREALKDTGENSYNNQEAFFIRSEKDRLLVIANTSDGLLAGVTELTRSTGYDILGMGPDWVYAPDFHHRPLTFSLTRAQRPSYYIRALWATSGQSYGVGTLFGDALKNDPDARDETVDQSYQRWLIGTRMAGQSMPPFPGHALQAYHAPVIQYMIDHHTTEGFLSAKTVIGPLDQRPEASEENQGWIWIVPPQAAPAKGRKPAPEVYHSDGKQWAKGLHWNLDVSVPFVRQIILQDMIQRAEKSFATDPEKPVIMPMDTEDGAAGDARLAERLKYPKWFPEYLASENLPADRPYVLDGYKGIHQPKEGWDPTMASDEIFACATWALHEFDKYIDSLPAAQRVTPSGKSRKDLVKVSFYSYNYHDVPPSFNPDPRIRVMIASYPKHRGWGKWKQLVTQEDVARAFQIMLPREPSGDYRIISLAYYQDPGVGGIVSHWDASPEAILENYRHAFDAGFRAMTMETDFNFGKHGLGYYLIAQTLWNPKMTVAQLDAIRDTWFQKAFGSAHRQMKAYYDFMLKNNYPANGPNAWAKAVQLIDAADQAIDPSKEPQAQQRIDDVKQYWYFHYLTDNQITAEKQQALTTYLWKGQMSYMVAMHMVARKYFDKTGRSAVNGIVGPILAASPARYTHEETQQWWAQVRDAWQYVPVSQFKDATLADGTPAAQVDLNDLTAVRQFTSASADVPFHYNSAMSQPMKAYMTASKTGDAIGFTLNWPFKDGDHFYMARDVPYGVDIWNPAKKRWDTWIDADKTTVHSTQITGPLNRVYQSVTVNLKAPRAGTYRLTVGRGGNLAQLDNPSYDTATGKVNSVMGFTYDSDQFALTQAPVWFYIPKDTKTLDLTVWDNYNRKIITLYPSLPDAQGRLPKPSRTLDVSAMKTYSIPLNPGEDGTLAKVEGNGFAFPLFHSIPNYFAKTPAALMLPRAIAKADGLTARE